MVGRSEAGAPSGRREFVLVTLLILFWGSVGLNRTGLGVIFPQIIPEFHLSHLQASLLLSGTSVTWAFSSWAGGWLSDRYGRRRVLVPAGLAICLVTASMGLAVGFWTMFLIRDLLGIGDGVGWSVGEATISEESAPQRRGMNQALFTAGYTLIGAGVGALIITEITAHLGWRWVFPIIGAATVPVVIAIGVMLRGPAAYAARAAHHAVDWSAAFGLLRNRSLLMLIIMGCAVLSWLQLTVFANLLFLKNVRHFSTIDAGKIQEWWGLAGAVGSLGVSFASDRWGRRPAIFVSALLCAASAALFLTGGFDQGLMKVLLGASGFFGFGLLPVVIATCVGEVVPEAMRGTALGVTNFFAVIIGTTLMPLLGGALADAFGIASALWIPIAAQVVIAVFIFTIPETAPRLVGRRAAMGVR